MGDFTSAEKGLGNGSELKKKYDAKRSLNNYVNQLKLHFDLNDDDVTQLLEMAFKSRKNYTSVKKWWQIWK